MVDQASPAAAEQAKNDSLYEDRPTSKKIIRVVTVCAYMISVSFVAIVLSGYYVFLWQPPNPRLLHHAHLRADPPIDYLIDQRSTSSSSIASNIEIPDRINVFREIIWRDRRNDSASANETIDSDRKTINVTENVDEDVSTMDSRNADFVEVLGNDSKISGNSSRGITRGNNSRIDDKSQLTDVYKNVNETNSIGLDGSSRLFMKRPEINENESTSRSAAFFSSMMEKVDENERSADKSSLNSSIRENKLEDAITREKDFGQEEKDEEVMEETIGTDRSTIGIDNSIIDSKIDEFKNSSESNGIDEVVTSPYEIWKDLTTPKFKDDRKNPSEGITEPPEVKEKSSHIPRIPVAENVTNDDTLDQQKINDTNFLNQQIDPEIPPDFSGNSSELRIKTALVDTSPLIVQPESSLNEDEREISTEKRLMQDTSDFDFV